MVGYETNKNDWNESVINCLGNPALFKAITAVREDSDKDQIFKCDDKDLFIICPIDSFRFYQKLSSDWDIAFRKYHKATLSELQERFKTEIE